MLKGIIARDKFEDRGVTIMEHCDRSLMQLEQAFDNSCTICCMYHRQADCEACPIREAAKAKAAWHGAPKDYRFFDEEVALA